MATALGWHHHTKISAESDTKLIERLGASLTEVASQEREIAGLIGKLFVQRRDVKAVQNQFGAGYTRLSSPFKMGDVLAHIRGEKSYGHYLVGTDGMTKLMAFDIDLFKTHPVNRPFGYWPLDPASEVNPQLQEFVPREAWADRAHPSRSWTKLQMKAISGSIASRLVDNGPNGWDMKCLVAYSGSKGVHVYAFFDEPTPAAEAREGAQILLRELGWKPKSKNFWVPENMDPVLGYPNFEIEVYPKQDEVKADRYGNLMRLPLGKNLKSDKDKAFFIDFANSPAAEMRPADPLESLRTLNPYQVGRLEESR